MAESSERAGALEAGFSRCVLAVFSADKLALRVVHDSSRECSTAGDRLPLKLNPFTRKVLELQHPVAFRTTDTAAYGGVPWYDELKTSTPNTWLEIPITTVTGTIGVVYAAPFELDVLALHEPQVAGPATMAR
jgi:hypothetical protein